MQVDYYVERFRTFYNTYSRKTDRELGKLFSDYVIIFDEIHNLLHREEYKFFHRLFHAVDNRKILLMSGTPMVDDVADFGLVMNLILPMASQLPTGRDFRKEFVRGEFITQEGEKRISQSAQGRVSYLRPLQTNVDAVYMGDHLFGLRYFRVHANQMSQFQTDVYRRVYESEDEGGWRRNSIQASLFVFPDGTTGSEGFGKYLRQTRDRFNATPEWNQIFRGMDTETRLSTIAKFSTKYANIIDNILRNPREKVFVYNQSIEEGGILMFAECLKIFGFQQIYNGFNIGSITNEEKRIIDDNAREGKVYIPSGGMNEPRLRFIVLSDKVLKNKNVFTRLLRTFNDVRNQHGQYIQVIIGGRQISEGLSFKDVTQVHVASPHWNYTVVSQAIARVIRFKSHRDTNTIVRVYLHAAIPQHNVPSIDIEMYKTNEIKDVLIQRLTRIVEKACFDCALNYDNNRIVNGVDGSRDCNYEPCDYKCNDVEYPYTRTEEQLDLSTYDIYYTQSLRDQSSLLTNNVYKELVRVFEQEFCISLTEFMRRFSVYDKYVIFKVLRFVEENHIAFINPYGIRNYAHIDGDQIFLTDRIYVDQEFTNETYSRLPILKDKRTFQTILEDTDARRVQKKLAKMITVSVSERVKILETLPRNIQELYIETAIPIFLQNRENSPKMVMEVIQIFGEYIHFVNDSIYSTLLMLTDNVLRSYKESEWQDSPPTKERIIMDKLGLVEGNETGYFIRYNGIKNTFNIIQLTGSVSDYVATGIDCRSKTIRSLTDIIVNVMGEEPDGIRKTDLCNQIFNWFEERDLIYYM